jgi:uncharacterized protein (DUF1778 family)
MGFDPQAPPGTRRWWQRETGMQPLLSWHVLKGRNSRLLSLQYCSFQVEVLYFKKRRKKSVQEEIGMTTARLDIRLDEDIKARAEKAAALLGLKSLTEYVVRLMDEDATQIIAQYETMVVEDNIFDQFITACEKAKKPNDALMEAAKFTEENGF